MFKIRDRKTGLFSRGGCWPKWSKRGKVWSCVGHVTSSLLNYTAITRIPLEQLEVVEYEVIEKSTTPAPDLLQKSTERKIERESRDRELSEKRQRERDEKAFEELRVRLGK